MEDGQHQAQRLVQLLRLATLQHFLCGREENGGNTETPEHKVDYVF